MFKLQRLSTESKRLPRISKSKGGEKKLLGCSSKSEILGYAKNLVCIFIIRVHNC